MRKDKLIIKYKGKDISSHLTELIKELREYETLEFTSPGDNGELRKYNIKLITKK